MTAQIGTVLAGTPGLRPFPTQHLPRHGLGAISPPGWGAGQQCPVGVPLPVKSQDLGLRRPWLRPRTSRPGSCNLTGSLCGYQKRSTFAATARGEFLRRAKDILHSHYLPLYEVPDQRELPSIYCHPQEQAAEGPHARFPIMGASRPAVAALQTRPSGTLEENLSEPSHRCPRGPQSPWRGAAPSSASWEWKRLAMVPRRTGQARAPSNRRCCYRARPGVRTRPRPSTGAQQVGEGPDARELGISRQTLYQYLRSTSSTSGPHTTIPARQTLLWLAPPDRASMRAVPTGTLPAPTPDDLRCSRWGILAPMAEPIWLGYAGQACQRCRWGSPDAPAK